MTLTIELTGEIEQRLNEQAAASGRDVPSFVQQILAEHFVIPAAANAPRRSPAEFRATLRDVIALHPPSRHFVDDSRESVYAGCGE